MLRIIVSLLFALGLASPIQAQEIQYPWNAGLGLDLAHVSVNRSSFPALSPAATINSNAYNLNFFAGYQIDEFLGLDFDWLYGGTVRANDLGQTTKLFGLNLMTFSATLNKTVNGNLHLYGKVGGTIWSFSSDQNVPKNTGAGPAIGLGADINLYGGNERKLRLEWDYY